MKEGLTVTKRPYESIDQLVNRFRSKVNSEGVLKDYKLNVMFSREERKRFKEFSNKRRQDKKHKRVNAAITRGGNKNVKRQGAL